MNQPIDLLDALEREPELALLVSQAPIAFHRSFVDITGSVLAALMLSAYMEQQELPHLDAGGWFEVDAFELEYRTGMSKAEQKAARKTLLGKGMIQERRIAFPARQELRVDFDAVSKAILDVARKLAQRKVATESTATSVSSGIYGASAAATWAQAH